MDYRVLGLDAQILEPPAEVPLQLAETSACPGRFWMRDFLRQHPGVVTGRAALGG